jgi:hypothetical protein
VRLPENVVRGRPRRVPNRVPNSPNLTATRNTCAHQEAALRSQCRCYLWACKAVNAGSVPAVAFLGKACSAALSAAKHPQGGFLRCRLSRLGVFDPGIHWIGVSLSNLDCASTAGVRGTTRVAIAGQPRVCKRLSGRSDGVAHPSGRRCRGAVRGAQRNLRDSRGQLPSERRCPTPKT